MSYWASLASRSVPVRDKLQLWEGGLFNQAVVNCEDFSSPLFVIMTLKSHPNHLLRFIVWMTWVQPTELKNSGKTPLEALIFLKKRRAVWEQFWPHFNWNTSLGQNACKRMLPRMLAKTQAHWLYPQLYIIGTDVDVGLYGHQGSQSYLFCNQIEKAAKQTTPQPTRLEILITWDGFYWKLMGRIGSNHLLVIKVISLRFNMSHCKHFWSYGHTTF
mgnify:CR=1 FL=1